jgi:hypothetical protein
LVYPFSVCVKVAGLGKDANELFCEACGYASRGKTKKSCKKSINSLPERVEYVGNTRYGLLGVTYWSESYPLARRTSGLRNGPVSCILVVLAPRVTVILLASTWGASIWRAGQCEALENK